MKRKIIETACSFCLRETRVFIIKANKPFCSNTCATLYEVNDGHFFKHVNNPQRYLTERIIDET